MADWDEKAMQRLREMVQKEEADANRRSREERMEQLKHELLRREDMANAAAYANYANQQARLNQQGQLLNELAAFRDMSMARTAMVSMDKFEALDARLKKLEALLDKVCVEHEDCCASLLSHACKKTTPQPSEGEKK